MFVIKRIIVNVILFLKKLFGTKLDNIANLIKCHNKIRFYPRSSKYKFGNKEQYSTAYQKRLKVKKRAKRKISRTSKKINRK